MDSQKTTSTPRKIVVTGANKGIGYSIVETLFTSNTPYDLILTARNPTLGQKTVETLRSKHPSLSASSLFIN